MNPIETAMYGVSQLFLTPVLILVGALFAYAFFALGAFIWQSVQRASAARRGDTAGHELLQAWSQNPALTQSELQALALKRMEAARIAARVAPLLGLVATMIPMGPALQALAEGQLARPDHCFFRRHPGPHCRCHHLRHRPRAPPLVRARPARHRTPAPGPAT